MRLMATGAEFTVVETGYMRARMPEPRSELSAGEVGYITASIKTVGDARVGDTVTTANNPASEPLPSEKPWKSSSSTTLLSASSPKHREPWDSDSDAVS